jgi:hypothetical protein
MGVFMNLNQTEQQLWKQSGAHVEVDYFQRLTTQQWRMDSIENA